LDAQHEVGEVGEVANFRKGLGEKVIKKTDFSLSIKDRNIKFERNIRLMANVNKK
jgi:hypothetical protein